MSHNSAKKEDSLSLREKEDVALSQAHADHSRHFREKIYVYPVISRRAGGLSVGINLNLDKLCNFSCAYCQVDRTTPSAAVPLDLELLESELRSLLDHYVSGLWESEPIFPDLSLSAQQIRDISISGDGESTLLPLLPKVLRLIVDLHQEYHALALKLVLITNGTGLARSDLRVALSSFTAAGGELWVKLDAGTPAYYEKINDSSYSFFRLMEQIRNAARLFPIKLQTMFCSVEGVEPSEEEIAARIDRFEEVALSAGKHLLEIQLYSLARPSANLLCASMAPEKLEKIAVRIRERLPGVTVSLY